MTGALIRKELRQHWWAFLLIAFLSMCGIVWVLLLTILQDQSGSHLFALRLHAFLLALSALVLGNRLVVAEYSASTQIFLESLPLPRLRIVVVKYFLGLSILLVCAATALGAALLAGMRTEVYTPRFLGILISRYLCYTIFVYSFYFAMGFLGLFRFAAYAVIAAGITLLVKLRDVALHELAPIHLIGTTFPFEREIYPVQSLVITSALSLAFFILAMILAASREGSISTLLGERMSYRDKIALTSLIFGIMVAMVVIDEVKVKEPYAMTGGSSAGETRIARVTVAPSSENARILAERLGKDLDEMAGFLDLPTLPPVFLIERTDLDPDQMQYGYLEQSEGVIIRTAYNAEGWSYARCLEYVSGEIIDVVSSGRISKEDRFWVLDGFTLYWPHRDRPDAPLDKDHHLLLRALYGTEILGGIRTPVDLQKWFSHQMKVGHEITAGISWSMLRVLEKEAGPQEARNFMRSVLAARTPQNALTTLRELGDPIESRFRRHTGLELSSFLDSWNFELESLREIHASELENIPKLHADLNFKGEAETTFQARYRVNVTGSGTSIERPVLLYGETAPFQVWVPEELLKRSPLTQSDSFEGWLPDTWGSGTGLAWTFAADHPTMRCRIISGWIHTHVP